MKKADIDRRTFLKTAPALPLAAAMFGPWQNVASAATAPQARPAHIKLSCNLYSFNRPLMDGTMTLDDVVEFCADLGFDAIDPTGYYFPNYPELADDAYIYHIRRKAFRLGLDISGTGVRNDFSQADAGKRREDIELVKKWVGLSVKLGAPVLRVFAGKQVPEGPAHRQATEWVVQALRECADYGGRHGIIIVLQNHADFIQTADQLIDILHRVDSEWLAVNLDIGSFRVHDAYEEVAKVVPYAATWQLKENVYYGNRAVKTDLNRMIRIIRDGGYRGYVPIETLGPGDPKEKVTIFLEEVRRALAATA